MEERGTAKRVPGRPPVHVRPRKKITAELDAGGIADLDMVAEQMNITRTEALDRAVALWISTVSNIYG